jgi:hypothetical protein
VASSRSASSSNDHTDDETDDSDESIATGNGIAVDEESDKEFVSSKASSAAPSILSQHSPLHGHAPEVSQSIVGDRPASSARLSPSPLADVSDNGEDEERSAVSSTQSSRRSSVSSNDGDTESNADSDSGDESDSSVASTTSNAASNSSIRSKMSTAMSAASKKSDKSATTVIRRSSPNFRASEDSSKSLSESDSSDGASVKSKASKALSRRSSSQISDLSNTSKDYPMIGSKPVFNIPKIPENNDSYSDSSNEDSSEESDVQDAMIRRQNSAEMRELKKWEIKDVMGLHW